MISQTDNLLNNNENFKLKGNFNMEFKNFFENSIENNEIENENENYKESENLFKILNYNEVEKFVYERDMDFIEELREKEIPNFYCEYSFPQKKFLTQIGKHDLEKLKEGNYLNDTIILFYLK